MSLNESLVVASSATTQRVHSPTRWQTENYRAECSRPCTLRGSERSRRLIDPPIVDYPPTSTSFDWSGFYAGVHGGYGSGGVDYTAYIPDAISGPDTREESFGVEGWFGGAQAGFNSQMDGFVLGVEGDVSLRGISGRGEPIDPSNPATSYARFDVDWMSTLRGRAGFAADRFLLYGTAGVAFAGVTGGVTNAEGEGDDRSDSVTYTGWVVGAGAEAAVTDNISLKAEYLYSHFGTQHYNFGDFYGTGDLEADAALDMHTIKAGLNFHF